MVKIGLGKTVREMILIGFFSAGIISYFYAGMATQRLMSLADDNYKYQREDIRNISIERPNLMPDHDPFNIPNKDETYSMKIIVPGGPIMNGFRHRWYEEVSYSI